MACMGLISVLDKKVSLVGMNVLFFCLWGILLLDLIELITLYST